MDVLYLLGLLIVWAGNLRQTWYTIKTKSTKSIAMLWPIALLVSIIIRMPLAWSSEYWVWKIGYAISLAIMAVLLAVIIHRRVNYRGL